MRKKIEAARVRLDARIDAVYEAGRPRDLRFSECLALAADDVKAAYAAARERVDACSTGKAYRSSGLLFWHR